MWDECSPEPRTYHSLLAVEALPGQFDQRADSCAQCVQLMAGVNPINHYFFSSSAFIARRPTSRRQ